MKMKAEYLWEFLLGAIQKINEVKNVTLNVNPLLKNSSLTAVAVYTACLYLMSLSNAIVF